MFNWFSSSNKLAPVDRLVKSHQLRPVELLPWAAAIAAYFLFDSYLPLGSQILIMILFAMSLDLVLGYAGIVTLGHAAFFGAGAYAAGIYAVHVSGEPLSGLVVGAVAGAIVGFLSGLVILRTQGLTLLMLTLAVGSLLGEAANKASFITGGADGLQGVSIQPILGLFSFDLFGRTAYVYCGIVLFFAWIFARRLVHSPFGRSLIGIRENVTRMNAIGSPVRGRLLTVYTISAAIAGIAGALLAQTTQFVGLTVLTFERSGEIVIMLIFGGIGRLYGAFVGATLYMIAQDQLSEIDPIFWEFWIGLLLVLVVMFARGGVLGLLDRAIQRWRRRS
ncbi:MAG TPA: branched-chain amino acid ABC transporter permease [Alphaproteobacteria bacterium]|nr:branched-chain amino acid ABC transporter permease [Alphaproteobacteria bacterium]